MSIQAQARMTTVSGHHFIEGRFAVGAGTRCPIIDPASEASIGERSHATSEEVHIAVNAANLAQKSWVRQSSLERAAALREVAHRLRELSPAIAECMTREMGKPFPESHWEVATGAPTAFEYYAELARHDNGRVAAPAITGQLHMTVKEPLGTVVLVVPYNFPVLLFCWQASAALAAGNAVIIKPSEATTLTTLLAMDAFTHLPPGLVQVLSGGADVGRQLVEHEHTHGIAFTGSIAAGQAVAHGAAERFKPVLIEASGNDPLIVMPSAPIAAAARNVAYATFLNAGQVCTSPERLYVHEAIYDAFLAALVKEAQALRVGHGLDDVDMGPMVSQRELQRVERIIGRALEQGARIMTGGRRPPFLDKGWFYEPTVLAVEHHMDIMHDECFGPVAPVCKVSSLDEALQLANDSRFALGASIYTHDLTEAMRAVNEIESGMVWVNTPLNDNDGVPFGGRKMSGVGRQLGAEGLEQFRRSKMVILAPEVVGSDELFPYKPEYGHRAVVKD